MKEKNPVMNEENPSLIITMTTVGSKSEAVTIAKTLVENKLAGCVQFMKISSVYFWENELQEDNEYLLLIKHTPEKIEMVHETITQLHPYETPEIVSVKTQKVNSDYFQWLLKETSD